MTRDNSTLNICDNFLQIVLIQTIFYFSKFSSIFLFSFLKAPSFSIVFGEKENWFWCNLFSSLVSSLSTAFSIFFFVSKTRKCLDFTFTVYFIHFILCLLYTRRVFFTFSWIVFFFISLVFTFFLSYVFCRFFEIKRIEKFVFNKKHKVIGRKMPHWIRKLGRKKTETILPTSLNHSL